MNRRRNGHNTAAWTGTGLGTIRTKGPARLDRVWRWLGVTDVTEALPTTRALAIAFFYAIGTAAGGVRKSSSRPEGSARPRSLLRSARC